MTYNFTESKNVTFFVQIRINTIKWKLDFFSQIFSATYCSKEFFFVVQSSQLEVKTSHKSWRFEGRIKSIDNSEKLLRLCELAL